METWNPSLCPACLLGCGLGPEGLDAGEPAAIPGDKTLRTGRFGDFQLLDEVAAGGMGVVYRALQVSLNRVVALKMIRAAWTARPEDRARLRTEAGAAARLHHPNIVAVHGVGEQGGQPYFTMEFIEGRTLAEMVERQPLDPAEAARQVRTIASAVHYAHEQGVLHRDLKPSNIIVDAAGEPHVTDFGLAKLAASDESHTVSGSVLGSPGYMPPEQARGNVGSVDARSDVYALGAILYELLTGRPPFRASTTAETLRLVLDEEPVPPRALNPKLPRDLETVCLKCLSKAPAQRYPTALAVAEELDRFRAGRPVQARPVGWLGRTQRWCRRQPALAASVVSLFLLMGALAVVSTLAAVRLERQGRATQRAREEADSRLQASLLAQAKAERLSGLAGRRARSLGAVKLAARSQPSLELRNEAIAALALPDLGDVVAEWNMPFPSPGEYVSFEQSLQRCVMFRRPGYFSICRPPDLQTVLELPTPVGARPTCVRFSPGGRYVAACYAPRDLELWDLQSTSVVHRATLRETSGSFVPLNFEAGDRQLAIVTSDNWVRVLDLPTVRERVRFRPSGPASGVQFGVQPDRMTVWVGEQVQVWDSARSQLLKTLHHNAVVTGVAWHPDGVHLGVGCMNGEVTLWNVPAGTRRTNPSHTALVWRVGFLGGGEFLWSAGMDNLTRFYDGVNGAVLFTAEETGPREVTPDGQRLVFIRADSAFGMVPFDCSASFRSLSPPSAGSQFTSTSLSPDGRWLVVGSSAGWHLMDTRNRREMVAPGFGQRARVLLTPDLSAVIGNTRDQVLRWALHWSTDPDGSVRVTVDPPETLQSARGYELQRVSLSADGRSLAVAGHYWNGVFDLESPWDTQRFSRNVSQSFASLAPDQPRVATADFFGRGILVWSRENGELLQSLVTNVQGQVAYSPDGRHLATLANDCRLWDAHSLQSLRRLDLRPAAQTEGTLVFSGDGRVLAAAEHQRVKLFEVATGAELATLTPPAPQRIAALSLSADGSAVAAATQAQTVLFWDLRQLRSELAEMGLDWK